MPPRWEPVDAHAVRAVAAGTASADQQQRAMRWIIERAAAAYEDTHFPTDADRCFANGRRFVGLRLVTIINLPADALASQRGHDVRNDH
jgi:hypothetical protein